MTAIGAISQSTAIRVIRPVSASGDTGAHRRDEPRQAYYTSGPTRRATPLADHAPFVVHTLGQANDNDTSPFDGAVAYLVTGYRMSDLPIGFLIARSA